jgi:transcriptional regulator with XRE-family HTH domain
VGDDQDAEAVARTDKERERRKELGRRVRMARYARGITNQVTVAEMAGIGVNTYRELERGEGNITTKHLWDVADVLDVRVTDLLGDPEN